VVGPRCASVRTAATLPPVYQTGRHPPGSGSSSHDPRNGAAPPGPVGLRTHASKYSNSVAKVHRSVVTFAQVAFTFPPFLPSNHPVILKGIKGIPPTSIESPVVAPAPPPNPNLDSLQRIYPNRNTRNWNLVIAVRCFRQRQLLLGLGGRRVLRWRNEDLPEPLAQSALHRKWILRP